MITRQFINKIYSNYGRYLNEHADSFKKPEDAVDLISDDNKYNHYINSLMDHFDEDQKAVVKPILDQQRKFLLEESSNILTSEIAHGYIVTYFPILCDIYVDDVLGQCITHYPVNSPMVTVPQMKLRAKVENSDGTEKSYLLPRAQYLVRTKPEDLTLLPSKKNKLFEMSASYPNKVNSTLSTVNKTYFILDRAVIEGTPIGGGDTTSHEVILSFRPDSRGQISQEIEFYDNDEVVNGSFVGHVDFDNGSVQYNCVLTNGRSDYKYTISYVIANVVFTARTGEVGRVKVSLINKGWDVNIDVREDFEFELDVETLQEYHDIYNVDKVKTMAFAIKSQTLLNRDHDISHLLKANESKMRELNAYEEINLHDYGTSNIFLTPGFISAIFQAVIPRLSIVSRYIFLNYRSVPQYLLTGIKTAAMLENMQEYAVSVPSMRYGSAGFDSVHGMATQDKASFRKQIILSSAAIDGNKIYQIFKPKEPEDLPFSVLINFIYKPLYIVEEITNSQKRVYVRSRNALELVSPEAVGCVKVSGFQDLITMRPDSD